MKFLGEKYLLSSDFALVLYESVKDLPIVDAHNHCDVREIYENKGWEDIWQVEAATDHYVWELMRRSGIDEERITGKASNYEKWVALATVFPRFVGNPTYEWIHLDLRRRFGIQEIIRKETADLIWNKTKELLKKDHMKPRQLLVDMNVEIMCTTDDPADDLIYHKKLQEEFPAVRILPTWRPDRACRIDKPDWKDYIKKLEQRTNISIVNLDDFIEALKKTHDYFAQLGCRCTDHAILEPNFEYVSKEEASKIFSKALTGVATEKDAEKFLAYMMYQFGEMNVEKNWVMQLHIGALRDYRDKLYKALGPDSGGDIVAGYVNIAKGMRQFFNYFDGRLKMVLYCLDPGCLPMIATIARAFENVFIGAPWWFNDSPYGMRSQLEYIATVDLLSNFVGMVTDSRKLMSYGSRTEMFRRVLCDVVANMVEKGQIPEPEAFELCKNLSYLRPKEFFFGR
ncbi:glucuronate isomerase [Pseudothermotoga thermarum]|uniref:Uronate isomerase n=1 Tax=Pseudothermotoga thermarum DSM 5069 TaxID=688269 RepID=F7YYM5_9THEM|nr:glucuronate isomerase [Pseudothermotoga thermarum]AEH51057.1 D-glucuronate isomerase [Pseudothermotoga thermarum DSM 5069]